MSRHTEVGKKGEEIAKEYLQDHGYTILAENWRYSRAEIDIIAQQNDAVIFVEVKTRSYNYYGPPEDFVNLKKQNLLSIAASAFMQKHNHSWEIRFDIIAIILESHGKIKIRHLRDAFFPGL